MLMMLWSLILLPLMPVARVYVDPTRLTVRIKAPFHLASWNPRVGRLRSPRSQLFPAMSHGAATGRSRQTPSGAVGLLRGADLAVCLIIVKLGPGGSRE